MFETKQLKGATEVDRLGGFVPPELQSRPRLPLHMPCRAHTRLVKIWYDNNNHWVQQRNYRADPEPVCR